MQSRDKIRAEKLRRARAKENRKTILWLLACFPYGLRRMWKKSCRWPNALKGLVSCAYLALAVAIVLYPAPGRGNAGSIRILPAEREVEVYGPQPPENIPEEVSYVPGKTVLAAPEDVKNDQTYVYCSEGAKCYHLGTCKYAYASAQYLTVYEATFLGYTPCKLCSPPTLAETEGRAPTPAPTDAAEAPADGAAAPTGEAG